VRLTRLKARLRIALQAKGIRKEVLVYWGGSPGYPRHGRSGLDDVRVDCGDALNEADLGGWDALFFCGPEAMARADECVGGVSNDYFIGLISPVSSITTGYP
jgi:hypothetical protein